MMKKILAIFCFILLFCTPVLADDYVDCLCGDANLNGRIDIGDAMYIGQYVSNMRADCALNLAVSDVNGDGDIDIGDAMFIAQFLVGNRACLCQGTDLEVCW